MVAIVEATVSEEFVKREQVKPEFVDSIEGCIDTTKLYVLPDGYIYAYMKHTEEVVVPGETVTSPAKAVLVKGYRYSHSGGSFKEQSNAASLIFPFDCKTKVSSDNPFTLTLNGMSGHTSYTEMYRGSENTSFPNNDIVKAGLGTFTKYSIHNIPVGKWFLTMAVQYSDSESYEEASVTLDDQTITDIAVYDDPAKASEAAHASITTTEGTTETIITEGWISTGHKFVADATIKSKPKSIVLNSEMQSLESSVSMIVPQLKKNKTIAFSGVYTGTLSEISIVQGEGSGFTEVKCVVTATTITVLKNSASVYSAEHGLTFGSYFSLVLATKNQNKTIAYLSSGGDTFTSGEFQWNTAKRDLKLYTNVPFAQYQFSFGSNDFAKEIWLYGDSYFDHWLPLSINRGYTNCLTDGYSGAASSSGLASFRIAIEHGTPSKVVWCLGMNNKDNGAVNQSWLDSITSVKEICEENGIELWVSTIPNTPTVDNSYKNAYIREHFANIIDISKYVGAEENTEWYTGLLSSDNIHPSTEGDYYIANIMEAYFPEMLQT